MSTDLIERKWNGHVILQHKLTAYLHAQAMGDPFGKRWDNFWKTKDAKAKAEALAKRLGLELIVKNPSPTNRGDALVEVYQGGQNPRTMIHPQLGIAYAYWLNDEFAVDVVGWTYELLTTGRVDLVPAPQSQSLSGDTLQRFLAYMERTEERMDRQDERQGRLEQAFVSVTNAITALISKPQPEPLPIAVGDGVFPIARHCRERLADIADRMTKRDWATLRRRIDGDLLDHGVITKQRNKGEWHKADLAYRHLADARCTEMRDKIEGRTRQPSLDFPPQPLSN